MHWKGSTLSIESEGPKLALEFNNSEIGVVISRWEWDEAPFSSSRLGCSSPSNFQRLFSHNISFHQRLLGLLDITKWYLPRFYFIACLTPLVRLAWREMVCEIWVDKRRKETFAIDLWSPPRKMSNSQIACWINFNISSKGEETKTWLFRISGEMPPRNPIR